MLRVHPDVAKVLKAKDNQYLEELEEILARPVLVKGDPDAAQREVRSWANSRADRERMLS